jgi:phage tail sheath protein FI
MRPGVEVTSRALPPPRTAPTDTGVAFLIGATATGVSAQNVTLVRSMTEYENLLGTRTGGSAAYDAADVFFHEGGASLYVSRTNPGTTREGDEEPKADEEPKSKGGRAGPDLQVVDPTVQAALDALTKDYGPGQVIIADPTLAAVAANQAALIAHAKANNRVALLSCADNASAATLEAIGTGLQTASDGRYAALFAPSAIVPGVTPGTTRTVPYSAVVAGQIARNDAFYSAAQPSAGPLGVAQYALDLVNRYTDAEYTALNDAGVSMARMRFGGVTTYGWRSCASPTSAADWLMLGWSRLNMEIAARAEVVGERYVFSVIDGRGRTIASFASALSAMLVEFYNDGSLYGATAEEAFFVDVGPSVNTPTTIANGELHAVLNVRMSPDTEWVKIEIVKVSTLQSLGAPAPAVARAA